MASSVLELPWEALVERLEAEAATGDRRAEHCLRALLEHEEKQARAGREPDHDSVIVRLLCISHVRPTTERE